MTINKKVNLQTEKLYVERESCQNNFPILYLTGYIYSLLYFTLKLTEAKIFFHILYHRHDFSKKVILCMHIHIHFICKFSFKTRDIFYLLHTLLGPQSFIKVTQQLYF